MRCGMRGRMARLGRHLLPVLWLLTAAPASAAVQLELDRRQITEGETVTLTITTDDARQSLDADLSGLEADFAVLDRRSETQLSIVDGRQTAVVRLVLTIEPRRSGQLTIPALDFGGTVTRSLTLQVDPAPELEPGELPPVFIEVEVTPRDGPFYVHAQLGLVVRVFYQQNLTEAAISQPEPPQASVRLLQETPFQAERGGERYRVLERRYAIFPERSGELVIPAMQLSGRLVERRSGSIWQPTARGRRISVASDELRLTIEPRPVRFSGGAWQPARAFELAQQVSGSDSLRVGEPVTRTVIIDAMGLEENMIAEPPWPELPGARIYPDQPQGISRDDGQWVLGHKEFRYAVVPEQEGELVLPELTVYWWDTVNDRERTAVLPAHRLYVQPSALVPPPTQSLPAADAVAAHASPAAGGAPAWWRWLALMFAALWLATLAWAARLRSGRGTAPVREAAALRDGGDEAGRLAKLRRACERGDAAAARRALQSWLRDFGPQIPGQPPLSPLEFAARCGDRQLRDAVQRMDATGFRQGRVEWDGSALWPAFEAWRKAGTGQPAPPSPTDLYAPANRR